MLCTQHFSTLEETGIVFFDRTLAFRTIIRSDDKKSPGSLINCMKFLLSHMRYMEDKLMRPKKLHG